MRTSNLLDNKLVKFYGNPSLYQPKRVLIVADYSKAFKEGKEARLNNHAISENPYCEGDGDAIWTLYDCWVEGYFSTERS